MHDYNAPGSLQLQCFFRPMHGSRIAHTRQLPFRPLGIHPRTLPLLCFSHTPLSCQAHLHSSHIAHTCQHPFIHLRTCYKSVGL